MTTFAIRTLMLCLLGMVLGGPLAGCGSSGPVVGQGIEKRVYLVKGENVDQPPEIVGGYAEVEKAKKYPEAAEKDDAYGVIWLQCTISASGIPTRVQLAQGGHPALETEALNVIQRLKFRPAERGGAAVPSQVQIPVIFQGPYAEPEKE